MSTEFNKQTIVERIRKIMESAGRTEAEMLTAQNLCQKLMMRYNIDKSDVFVSDGDIGISEVENTFEGHETRYWTWDLLCRIGSPYNVEIVRTEKRRPVMENERLVGYEKYEIYRLVGSKEDREIVQSIFTNILPVIRASRKLRWKEYQKRIPKKEQTKPATFAKSYFTGYGVGLYDKLKAERDEFLRDMEDETSTSNSETNEENLGLDGKLSLDEAIQNINNSILKGGLVVSEKKLLNTAQQKWEMIVARKKQLVDDFMKTQFAKATEENDRKSKKQSLDAYESGYVDGKHRYHGHQLDSAENSETEDSNNLKTE